MFHKPSRFTASRSANVRMIDHPDAFVELFQTAQDEVLRRSDDKGVELDKSTMVVTVSVEVLAHEV